MYRELLLGAGRNHEKRVKVSGREEWQNLTTLDINPDHKPDVLWNLDEMPLPFDNDSFDEIHAYELLEHLGQQGDWRRFFAEWSEFWRILKPGGVFCGSSPALGSPWLWGDPGHTRTVQKEQFTFLNQPAYENVGRTPMSDYRFVYKADFDAIRFMEGDDVFVFVLQAVKPSRYAL